MIFFGGDVWVQHNGFVLEYNIQLDSVICELFPPTCVWDIEFINKDTGFIVSFNGIDRTVDGGNSWASVWDFEKVGAIYGELYSITCDPIGNIYASGRKRDTLKIPEFFGTILKSEDRGKSWVEIKEIPDGYIVNLNYKYNKLYCHDKNALCYYSSSDFGEQWQTDTIPLTDPLLKISDIEFLSQDHVLVSIAQELYFSSDDPSREQYSVDMIIDSPDLGNTWYRQYIHYSPFPPRDSSLNTLVSVNDTIIYLFGMNLALITENQGGPDNPILSVLQNKIDKKTAIYPNPVTDIIYIQGLDIADSYAIATITGQIIKSQRINPSYKIAIPVATLKEGLYFLYLFDNESVIYSSVFIKN